MVSEETKANIVAEASAHFKLQDQILVFQDGTEVPDNFNIPSYTQQKKIKFLHERGRVKDCTCLMLVREKVYAPIFTIL